jgi:membrane-bound lytic murein transglycosylase F
LKLIFAVVCIALLGSCSPNLPLIEQIRLLGELRVVTRNAPTTFYYGATERYGIEYELTKAFADHLGVRLNLRTVDQIDEIFPEVTGMRAHIAAAGLTITASRQDVVTFSPSYQEVAAQLVYRMGEKRPASIDEIAGNMIEVRAGSGHVEMLHRALEKVPGLAWAENRSTGAEALMKRVADGTIDYAVVNSNEFELLRNYYPEVRVAFDLESSGSLGWALPRYATDLQEEVSAFFANMEATGELAQILDRYYLAARDFDFVGASAFVRHLNQRFAHLRPVFQAAERETGIDWKLLAAIAYQESHWNPEAVSPTGVKGLMMLTANTANMVGITDRTDPRQSILGGARYLARVFDKFPDRIPAEDRMLMAVAAYNIGFGHVEDARIITESRQADKDSWEDVSENLPLLTDERWYPHLKRGYAPGSIPVQYVENVRHYYWLLDRLTGTKIFSALAIVPPDRPGKPI